MSTQVGPRELLEIAEVASRYYRDGHSKVDIAKDMGTSRFRVARLIGVARELGIVRISIAVPDSINPALSSELGRMFGLRQAIVVDTPDEPAATLRADLGRVAGRLLVELVQENDVVGIAWGRTLNPMTDALKGLKHCSVVQMTGALEGAGVNENAIELVRRMSDVSGGPAYPIYAPLLLDDAAVAQSLRSQAKLSEVLAWYERLDIAIVPIGSWDPPSSQLYDSLTPRERQELLDAGVRADSSGVMITASGDLLETPLSQRIIGISGDQLKRIPEVIAVAGGLPKAEAVSAALRARMITTLVTNSSVAKYLLQNEPPPS